MRTPTLSSSALSLATRGFAVCFGFRISPRRKRTPPPIFLREENKVLHGTYIEARKINLKDADEMTANVPLPIPVISKEVPVKALQNSSGLITRLINWIQTHQLGRTNVRRLRVAETVSFGDKRFVAVLQIDGYQYLVGGGATNIALLAKLNHRESFSEVFKQTMTVSEPQIEHAASVPRGEKA